MDEKSDGMDESCCKFYSRKPDTVSIVAGPSATVSLSPSNNDNNNDPLIDDKLPSVASSPSTETNSLMDTCVSDAQDIPSTDSQVLPVDSLPFKCKYYYNSDGSLYIVESAHAIDVERYLPFLADLENSPEVLLSVPTNLCFMKISLSDDDETPSSAVFSYKIVDAEKYSSDWQASPSGEYYANQNTFLCLLCNVLAFSTSSSFVEHSVKFHDVKMNSDELELFENSSISAIFYNKENNAVLSFLLPVNAETDKVVNEQNAMMTPMEVATTLMLASNLSASRLLQMQTADHLQQKQQATLNRCTLHPDGKTMGVECPKCDLILGSSRSLGGHITMMHSRNSCKTLKCPKCNWHYKYQETLEIHMNEKHNDAPTSCVYCVANSPHPRLGRGEQWSCGYKPYRCDVCKYSTTTKGNLAIHMQSDKHLNNVQEIQKTKLCSGISSAIDSTTSTSNSASAAALIQSMVVQPADQSTSINASQIIVGDTSNESTPTTHKGKPSWRCDVCNYETNVARNLRIHMTSEKHTQNLLILHQSVKNLQQQTTSSAFHHHRPMIDVLSPMSFLANDVSACSSGAPPTSSACLLNFAAPTCADDVLTSSLALNLQNLMFESTLNDGKLFQCCICLNFTCDTLTDLINHSQNTDRARPNESDVSLLAGHYVCNLCHYKTHLKANFQLHTKTDKHLQRLQLVNHVREGGPQNELRLKYLNPNNPVQLRCVACNEFSNSFHKLQMHLSTNRHRSFAASFEKISTCNLPTNNCLYCTLCDVITSEKRSMLTHLHSERHNELLNQILIVIESSGGLDSNPLNWIEIRDKSDEILSELEDEEEEDIEEENVDNDDNCELGRSRTMTDDGGNVHCCGECNFSFENENALELHIQQEHQSENVRKANEDSIYSMCPLCQTDCGSNRERLECHLSQMHKVPKEGVQRLINWLPTTTTSTSSSPDVQTYDDNQQKTISGFSCPTCNFNFDDIDALFDHQQQNDGHVETKVSASSSSTMYFCWSVGCKEHFDTLQLLQSHYRKLHVKKMICNADSTTNNFKCPICFRSFHSNFALNLHVERSHLLPEKVKLIQQNAKNNKSSPTTTLNGDEKHLSSESPMSDVDFTTTDEHLNSSTLAQKHYNDVDRPFKCDRCEMAFTKQIFLAVHNRTLSHRQNKVVRKTSSTTSNGAIFDFVDKKYKDLARPFKCDVCKESFTQKNILVVHCNSVSHLNKLKKFVGGASSSTIKETLKTKQQRTNSSPSTNECKNYKCNICKVAYGSGCTLDVHLRSVAHQSRVNRLYELLAIGEIDLNQPLIEQPDGNRSPNIDKNDVWQNLLIAASSTNGTTSPKLDSDFVGKNCAAKTSLAFRKMLENYGFEVVMQYNEAHHRKRSTATSSTIATNENDEPETKKMKKSNEIVANLNKSTFEVPELKKCKCSYCEMDFSSVWVLKAHVEQVHKRFIPVDEVEKISNEFKKQQKIISDNEMSNSVTVSSSSNSVNVSSSSNDLAQNKVVAQQQNSITSPPVTQQNANQQSTQMNSQMAAMAAMSMSLGLGVQFPFVGGIPFGPFGMHNPFMMMSGGFDPMSFTIPTSTSSNMNSKSSTNSHSSTTPMLVQQQQKRARTRITDDQLKVLREYFDINNSPSEEQIEQMSSKSGLPQKVIKHWFRNTLFKERQRSKDSPYNFNIPPSLGIDLEEYEKTGETRIHTLNADVVVDNDDLSPKLVVDETKPEEIAVEAKKEIKEETNDEINESSVKQESLHEYTEDDDESYDDFDNYRDTNVMNTFNAHETLRQLAAVGLSNMQMQFRSNTSADMNPLSSLLNASMHASSTTSSSSADLTNMIANALSPTSNQSMISAGRRANRTRFTEWQVKTLQDFFEKNAYPKDDDLETLSNKLNLSPRVIVVWFQNARQKARKIYENQPNSNDIGIGVTAVDERFVRTPGLNYQCKKCKLVFQRYYELIKHQKSSCFKDETKFADGDQSPPPSKIKSSTNSLNSQTNSSSACMQQKTSTSQQMKAKCSNDSKQLEHHLKVHETNPSLLNNESQNSLHLERRGEYEENSTANMQISSERLFILNQKFDADPNPTPKMLEQISLEVGLPTKLVQNWFQNARTKDSKRLSSGTNGTALTSSTSQFFNKRCPFCGILFHSKLTMESHLHSKHPSQNAMMDVNVACLPDAEEVPTITTVPLTEVLWNATTSSSSLLGLTMVPGTTQVKKSNELNAIIDRLAPQGNKLSSFDETPLDLSRSLKHSFAGSAEDLNNVVTSSAPVNRTPSNNDSNEDDTSFMSYEENDDTQSFYSQESPSNSPQHQILAALARPQKRFRTRLTPQQIRVMKHFFSDFKTPSMSECEILGNEMGLHKRVVQVWFQNARAKERKVKISCGSLDGADLKMPPSKCLVCDVAYSGRVNMQDHSFSKSHIERVRKNVEETDENPSNSNSFSPDFVEKSTDTTNLLKQRTSNVASIVDEATSSRSSVKPTSVLQQQTFVQNVNHSKKSSNIPDTSLQAASLAQNLLPYMYAANNPAAYYASMMMPAGFGGLSNGNLFYDPNIHGTPLNLLQIPADVMQAIGVSMQKGKEFYCRFTQDGQNMNELNKLLNVRDRMCVGEKDLEVGWACRSCVSVFQAEPLFLNHQRLICQSKERAFKLIQTHYECKWCNLCFGTQAEFVAHCETSDHQTKTNGAKI